MQKYKQYCPVARASEILADRWTPLIVRELVLGSHRFNEIERGLPGISRSLLASRLRDLEDSGVVERLPGAQSKATEYHLSEAGRDLKAGHRGAWRVGRRAGRSASRGRRSWTRGCWSGRFTSGSIASCCRNADGCRVRLHRSSRTTSVAAARASRGVRLRDASGVRFRSRSSARIWRSSIVVWLGHIEYDAAIRCRSAWSSKGFPLLRSNCRGGSCGARWRVSFGNASTRWRTPPAWPAPPTAARCDVTWVSHGSGRRHWRLPASTASHRGLVPHRGCVCPHSSARRSWRRPCRQR